ncbi:MAG TPA: HNH endonuclease [Ktedonobacterales bacterium]|nr:HNH endonuclease [Ktedonobacterales bacterium]
MPMDVEHIFSEALGGQTEEENLWLACSMCNDHKGNRVTEIDPLTGETVQLFNPRRQRWHDHFAWASGGEQIIGLTPVGRATVIALKLNRALLVKARRVWMRGGVHPPEG